MDSECSTTSVTVTSSRCMPETKRTCLILSTIYLCYEWKTRPNFKPFARNLPLPGLSLLDNVLTRFISWHLVKRYPLAFGTWHKQLDIELPLFPKILGAILAMIKRSPNPAFVSAAKRHLRDIKRSQRSVITLSETAMALWLGELPRSSKIELTLEDAFSMSLEDCYKRAVRKPAFKSKNHMRSTTADAVDDEDLIAQDAQEPTQVPSNDSLFGLDPALASKRYFQTSDLFSGFTFELPEPSRPGPSSDVTAASFDHILYSDLDEVRLAALPSDVSSEHAVYISEEESDLHETMEDVQASDALYSVSSSESSEYPIGRSQSFYSQVTSPVELDLDHDSGAETTPPLLPAGQNVDDYRMDSEPEFDAVDLQEHLHSKSEEDVDSTSYPATTPLPEVLDMDSDSGMDTGIDAVAAPQNHVLLRMDDDTENHVILSSQTHTYSALRNMAMDSASDTDLSVPALIHSQSSHSQSSYVETRTPEPMQSTFEPSIVTHDGALYTFLDDSEVVLDDCGCLMEMEMEDGDYVDGRNADGEDVDEDVEEDNVATNYWHQELDGVDEDCLLGDTEKVGAHDDFLESDFVQEDGIIIDLDED